MKIELAVVRAALNVLLDHAEEMTGGAVEVDEDLYWFIPREQLGDPGAAPTDMTLGSLDDDWSHLKAVVRGDEEPFGHMLVWAASVLRALGDRTM